MSAPASSGGSGLWAATIGELIRRTATELPGDVVAAIRQARQASAETPRGCGLLQTLLDNSALAQDRATPICQDTGTLTFWVETPDGARHAPIAAGIREAVAASTRRGYLRRNTIDTLSGQSRDDNLADGAPVIHFETDPARDDVRIRLLLKGGGCENVSAQYSLPDADLQAGRDLDGVRACVLHAVWRAQGLGCAPGVAGVCIGGDRAEGYHFAKRQLLRPLPDAAPEPELARLETHLLAEANSLGIGPMGLGGQTTLLAVKLAARSRLPASYFVTIAYSCWACRRRGLTATLDGEPGRWLE